MPLNKSSPRKRGCFRVDLVDQLLIRVFPAQAGVFLTSSVSPGNHCRLPRASGGVSGSGEMHSPSVVSSPRKRGCFPPAR